MDFHELMKDSFQGVAMGMMDGLITILGILMGVGVATESPQLVVISGLVGGIANSFGTSVGFYTSEQAERGQQIAFYKKKGKNLKQGDMYIHTQGEIYLETAFAFSAGVAALIVPIMPFLIGLPVFLAMAASMLISISMLYVLGFYIGKLNHENMVLNGFKYAGIGTLSAIIALLIGELLKHVLVEGNLGIF